MAYFAKLGTGNIIEKVISINNSVITDSNGIEQEQLGVDFINGLYNTNDTWKQTSYNTIGGVHLLGGTPFRKNYAGIGYTYDSQKDAFISPKPFNSWILNETTCIWESPVTYPTDSNRYSWNESTLSWDLLDNN
jgi:hypothetical protein